MKQSIGPQAGITRRVIFGEEKEKMHTEKYTLKTL
jgi:hypothetical protein